MHNDSFMHISNKLSVYRVDASLTRFEILAYTDSGTACIITRFVDRSPHMSQNTAGRKIFFTDIDDTLLNTDKTLSDKNREALDHFLELDHILCMSTGRALNGASALLKRLDLYGRKNVLISSFNGGLIYDTHEEKTLLRKTIPLDTVYRAFDLASDFGVHIQTYTDDAVVTQTDNHHLRKYLSIQKLEVVFTSDIRTFQMNPPVKLLSLDYDDPSHLTAFRDVLGERMNGELDCFNSNPNLLEIVPSGVNKGSSLHFLADYYHLPIENTISAGDAENDLPMIREAGIGCAMKNADDALKAVADYVTERDNNHGGVAEILDTFCFSQ